MDSEKSWRRRLRRTIEGLACACLALACLSADAEPDAPAVAALNRFIETVDTLTAEFEEQVYDADGVLLEESAGSFALERPGRFVWHYREPDELIMLADGEQLWMYDVELEQASVSPLEEGAGSPAMLLSGRGSVLDSFEIESTYARDGLDWARLVPLEAGTDFSAVAIGFDEEGLPLALEFVSSLNQTTRVELSDAAVNEPLDDDLFELDLPDDVDVIGNDG